MTADGNLHRVLAVLPQASRPLDVGEQERHRSRRHSDLGPFPEHSVAGWDDVAAAVLEGLVARADLLLEAHELGTGLQTDLVEGHASRWYCERIGLSTTPVQGHYEQRPPSFAERFLRDQRFEHRDPLMMVTTRELELGQLLSDAAVELFGPRRFTATRLPVAQLRKRRPSPEVDRCRELRRSSDQVAVLNVRAAFSHQQLEAMSVDIDL